MTSPYHISTLLDKVCQKFCTFPRTQILPFVTLFQMMSIDKDFRFMATNDLMVELQKDSIKLDDDSERKVEQLCKLIKAGIL